MFLALFFVLFSYIFLHIPDHNLCLRVSRGCSRSHQWVIGMEDTVRHVGSPVREECSMSGVDGGGPEGDKTHKV